MAQFLDVWALLADRICAFLETAHPMRAQFDLSTLHRCQSSFAAILEVQQTFAWWLSIRTGNQHNAMQDFIIPHEVMHEIMQYGAMLPVCALDYQPALAGPKTVLLLLRTKVLQMQEQEHPAHARWLRGAGLVIQDVRLKDMFADSSLALGQYRQAELDAFFLTLFGLLTHLSKHAWQLQAAAISKEFAYHVHDYHDNRKLQHGVHLIFLAVQNMTHPLQWDPYARWQRMRQALQNGLDKVVVRDLIREHGLEAFVALVENVMSICHVPHEFKVPIVLALATKLGFADTSSLMTAYHCANVANNDISEPDMHPMGWIVLHWLLHWHPHHSDPLHVRLMIPANLQRAFMKWYNHGPYANTHSFMQIMPQHLALHPRWSIWSALMHDDHQMLLRALAHSPETRW